MPVRAKESEVVEIVRSRLKEAACDEQLLEWAVLGFEAQLDQLYERFQRGEISLGYLAQALGLSVWKIEALLERRGLRSTNL